MSLASRVAKNTSILIIGRVVNMGLVFATSIFVVRGLGPADYGQYALIYAFPALFSWFAAFGTDNILVREAARLPEKAAELWANGLVLRLILSLVALVALYVTAIIAGYENLFLILLLLGSIEVILLHQFHLPDLALRIELQQWRTVATQTVHQLLWLALLLGLTAADIVSLQYLVLGRLAIVILELVLLWWLARPFIRLRLVWSGTIIADLLRDSWPLALTALSVAVYSRIDRVLIERFLSAEELGYYATAGNLVGLMSIVPLAFVGSIYPLLCKQIDKDKQFDRLMSISFRWLLVGIMGLSGLLFIVGSWLITWVYGPEFAPAVPLFRILIWTRIFSTYGIVVANALMARNLHHYLTLATVAGAIVGLVGNLLVLPILGVVGSAVVSVISYVVAGMLFLELIPATRAINRQGFSIMLRVISVCMPLLFLLHLGNISVAMQSLLFLMVFPIGLLAVGAIKKDDFSLLKGVFLPSQSKG